MLDEWCLSDRDPRDGANETVMARLVGVHPLYAIQTEVLDAITAAEAQLATVTAERDEARRDLRIEHRLFLIEAAKHAKWNERYAKWIERYMRMKRRADAAEAQIAQAREARDNTEIERQRAVAREVGADAAVKTLKQDMAEAAVTITSLTAERDEARETNRKLNRLNQEYEHAFAEGLRALDEKAVGGQHFTDYAKMFLQTHHWHSEALKRAEAAEAQLAQARDPHADTPKKEPK